MPLRHCDAEERDRESELEGFLTVATVMRSSLLFFFIFYIINIYYINKSISHHFLQLFSHSLLHFSLILMASSSSSLASVGEQIKRKFSAYNSIFSTGLAMLETIVDEEEISSRPRKTRKVINRQREEAHLRLMKDYFDDDCVFDEGAFRRRFQMYKGLFLRIVDDLENANVYFTQ